VIVRRCANAVATLVVALAVALAVPVSQLTTVAIVQTCCCPDPDHCHCPDHKADHGTQSSLRACHQQREITMAPQLPSFAAPAIAIVQPALRLVAPPVLAMMAPHAPPTPKRPDAPS
jgi:hypothetical protein